MPRRITTFDGFFDHLAGQFEAAIVGALVGQIGQQPEQRVLQPGEMVIDAKPQKKAKKGRPKKKAKVITPTPSRDDSNIIDAEWCEV